MKIDEIKSVSIIQFLESQGHQKSYVFKGSYWYLSPFRSEQSPSFNVNPTKNLWYDYGEGLGGNIINLVQRMNPTWNNHEVLSYLEKEIRCHNLEFSVDYLARVKEQEEYEVWKYKQMKRPDTDKEFQTVIDSIGELTHPYLRDYILQRRIDFDIAKELCKEVHYSIYDKHYYAIAFENIDRGMEARNKYSKRSIGKKSISIVRPFGTHCSQCCVFEGLFDMLTYASIKKWQLDIDICVDDDCDYIVLNSVSNVKLLLPLLVEYSCIHCYLDNDDAGVKATQKIKNAFACITIDESHRYSTYKDVNDVINGITKLAKQ